jgi:predicted nucleic acid-binding protein
MPWTVDTCVLVDIIENDPVFGLPSATCLKKNLRDGLCICPVSFVELGPTFAGNTFELRMFLNRCGIAYTMPLDLGAAEIGHKAWHKAIAAKRKHAAPKRPVADILIGAFAMQTRGIITRNPKDFRNHFPDLKIIDPTP